MPTSSNNGRRTFDQDRDQQRGNPWRGGDESRSHERGRDDDRFSASERDEGGWGRGRHARDEDVRRFGGARGGGRDVSRDVYRDISRERGDDRSQGVYGQGSQGVYGQGRGAGMYDPDDERGGNRGGGRGMFGRDMLVRDDEHLGGGHDRGVGMYDRDEDRGNIGGGAYGGGMYGGGRYGGGGGGVYGRDEERGGFGRGGGQADRGGMYGRGLFGREDRGGFENRGVYGRGVGGMGSEDRNVENRGGVPLGGHRGKGPRNFTRSDERIREIVCETLADDDRIDATHIDIEVRNGEVTLSGTVEDRRAKRLAEDVIEDLPGVTEVHNHIRAPGLFGRSASTGSSDTVDQLNSLLRGEISAVETYRMALEKLERTSVARADLETCLRSHEERMPVLRERIQQLGGTPSTGSGPWGVFAKVVEGGARAFGDKAAIAALEEGEDHGLRDYRSALEKLDADGRNLIKSRLLPAQEDTHARMSALKRRLASTSASS